MTKIEAWQAWCVRAGTADLATEFTLENSSQGKAFGFAWDEAVKAEREACAKVCEELVAWYRPNPGGTAAKAIRSRT